MAADLEALRAQLLVSKRVEVVGGGGFDVFGLSLPSIVAVCRNHFEDCRQLFMQLASQSAGQQVTLAQATAIGDNLLLTAPRIAAEFIARSAGYTESEAVDLFAALPFPVQLDALEKIASLTFTTEMPPKKVLEVVVRAVTGLASPVLGNLSA